MKKYILPDTQFKLGKPYNPKGDQAKSWVKITTVLEAESGSANYDRLIAAVRFHPGAGGGQGFVNYVIENDWLVRS